MSCGCTLYMCTLLRIVEILHIFPLRTRHLNNLYLSFYLYFLSFCRSVGNARGLFAFCGKTTAQSTMTLSYSVLYMRAKVKGYLELANILWNENGGHSKTFLKAVTVVFCALFIRLLGTVIMYFLETFTMFHTCMRRF